MNTAKIATALNTISVAFGELAEALNESPDPVRSGGSEAGTVARPAPTTFADGRPIEEPPLFPDGFESETAWAAGPKSPSGMPFAPPPPMAQDQLLAECPVHFKPWTIKEGGMSRNGKPYSAFWKCSGKNDDGSYCNKKPVKDWVKTHDPEKALAAA